MEIWKKLETNEKYHFKQLGCEWTKNGTNRLSKQGNALELIYRYKVAHKIGKQIFITFQNSGQVGVLYLIIQQIVALNREFQTFIELKVHLY